MDTAEAHDRLKDVPSATPTWIHKKMGLMEAHAQTRIQFTALIQGRQEIFNGRVAFAVTMLEAVERTKIIGRPVAIEG